MLRIDGGPTRHGRRDFLRVGSLALGGLTLPQLLATDAAAAGRLTTGKSVIFLFQHGGPSQIETFDPKMTAPVGIQSATGEVQTKIPGITFVVLQYGISPGDPEITRLGLENLQIVDGDIEARKNLDGSAAQVAAMDLVITVSNTTAHLAGAQGVPVWALLPSGPGCLWYWFQDRNDSPWYPSMRIFRQNNPGAWQAVVDDVARTLVEAKTQGRL